MQHCLDGTSTLAHPYAPLYTRDTSTLRSRRQNSIQSHTHTSGQCALFWLNCFHCRNPRVRSQTVTRSACTYISNLTGTDIFVSSHVHCICACTRLFLYYTWDFIILYTAACGAPRFISQPTIYCLPTSLLVSAAHTPFYQSRCLRNSDCACLVYYIDTDYGVSNYIVSSAVCETSNKASVFHFLINLLRTTSCRLEAPFLCIRR